MVCPSLSVAMETIQSPPLSDQIESVFILGGSAVYEVRGTRNSRQYCGQVFCQQKCSCNTDQSEPSQFWLVGNSDWWVTFRFSRLFADKGLAKCKPQYILHIHLNLVAIAMVTSFMDV